MTFLYPYVLILLIIPAILVYMRKKSSVLGLESVFAKEVLKKLLIGINQNRYRFYIGIIGLCFMIVALARPVLLGSKLENFYKYESFNMVVLFDISKSMEANDVFPNRLEFAKKALFELMDRLKGARIATVAFTHDAFLVNPFSEDFESIKFLINNLNPNSLSSKGSEITSALNATKKVFENVKEKKKIVLLVSDGADGREVEKISKFVKEEDITLHVLNIGTKKGIALKDENGFLKDKKGNIVISKRDDSIAKVSSVSGGAFLALNSSIDKLDWLAKSIKKSAVSKSVKKVGKENLKELFYYPLSLALMCLFFLFNSPRVFFLAVLMFLHVVPLQAEMFDFWNRYEANKSYKEGDFKRAEEYFSKINKDEAIYNKANTLYKQKKYKEALNEYKKIKNFKGENELKRLYNLGNTYAKLNKIDDAIKSYEDALKIKNDEDTKYNLELLKKLKKQQQKNKNQKNSNKKNNKKKKDQKQNKQNKKNGKNKQNEKKDKKQQKSKKAPSKNENKKAKKKRKISEEEAKKWEKIMKKRDFTTRPMPLVKGDENEISW